MQRYLRNRKAIIIKGHHVGPDKYLQNRPAMAIAIAEKFEQPAEVVIPPLNTDVRFGRRLPLHQATKNRLCKLRKCQGELSEDHPKDEDIIPPLNADIRFSKSLPPRASTSMYTYNPRDHDHPANGHDEGIHTHDNTPTNFSWAVTTAHDTELDLIKKQLIHEVQTQHACGSCWAMCLAAVISDCLVVSGAVGWAPNISPSYIMMGLPQQTVQDGCGGGDPAAAAKYLEQAEIADNSCVDYSWCSGDSDLCTSVSSARHFDADTLTKKLNENIPTPRGGCYYGDVEKYVYTINPGTETFHINQNAPLDVFRASVKAHILDFGPTIGGFVVLSNFERGVHTNPNLNGGVYFDTADYDNYNGGEPTFRSEATYKARGFHAISIMGWGVAKNIKYNNTDVGDVPYWHCRNSWGTNWGHTGGYFKMAMYPFNKISQFDTEVMTTIGGPIGSMVLIRATQPPLKKTLNQISRRHLDKINKAKPESYYKATTSKVRTINRQKLDDVAIRQKLDGVTINGYAPGKQTTRWVIMAIAVLLMVIIMVIHNQR